MSGVMPRVHGQDVPGAIRWYDHLVAAISKRPLGYTSMGRAQPDAEQSALRVGNATAAAAGVTRPSRSVASKTAGSAVHPSDRRVTSLAVAERVLDRSAPHVQQESPEDVTQLWLTYKLSQDATARERLLLHYFPLVEFVAERVSVSVGAPSDIPVEDLVSYGIPGLTDAIDRHNIEQFSEFEDYAKRRIRAAIVKELRGLDWIPRSVRSKTRDVDNAYAALAARLQRTPTESEVAAQLGVPLTELHHIFSQMSYANLVAQDEVLNEGQKEDSLLSMGGPLEDHRAEDPALVFEGEEAKRLLADAIDQLPEREKVVVTLYYYEGMTLAEIGRVLGVTESRVRQMHSKAVLQLRTKLADTA